MIEEGYAAVFTRPRPTQAHGAGGTPRRRSPRPHGQDGFTLIELLAVIAIIGILTALIIPRVIAAMSSSVVNNGVQTAQDIAAAMEGYYNANGQFPPVPSHPSSSCNNEAGNPDLSGVTISYEHLIADLQPYGPSIAPNAVNANFWIEQLASENNANNECVVYSNTGPDSYTLTIYGKNGGLTPIVIDVTAGTGGDIYVGSRILASTPHAPSDVYQCGSSGTTACNFGETIAVTW